MFGLKWRDVDFEKRRVHIVRSVVDQVEGEPKTAGSKRPLPFPTPVVEVLQQWRAEATFSEDGYSPVAIISDRRLYGLMLY